MRFQPPFCPFAACPAHTQRPFRFRRKGYFTRGCDGRRVARFTCLMCRRSFSTQTFRLDYRLHRPDLWIDVFAGLVSKRTLRQSGRILGCSRKVLAHRLSLFGEHCRALHAEFMQRVRMRGGMPGVFQLDELETYEHDRRLCPLTVPVLIERRSFFVLGCGVAPLPARGGLTPKKREKKKERERLYGKRRSGSREAVSRVLQMLRDVTPAAWELKLQTDEKLSYAAEASRLFGAKLRHKRYSSRAPRVHGSPLFPINHTLAQMRDTISRLVRRTWAASKKAVYLERHQWIWIAWRNYVRGITNQAWSRTPAMVLGVADWRFTIGELLSRRVFCGR